MSEPLRRLPVYLVLDCSGSMAGDPIEAVRQGIKALLQDLRGDPQSLETAYLSVITFAREATQVCPLTELTTFCEPVLNASGSTSLGAALQLLKERIAVEVQKPSIEHRGDWKPLIFLMTDGKPTDLWEEVAADLKENRIGVIIACAAGAAADPASLKRLTDDDKVLELNSIQPDTLKSYFRWVSSSIKAASRSMAIGGGDGTVPLPPPPGPGGSPVG